MRAGPVLVVEATRTAAQDLAAELFEELGDEQQGPFALMDTIRGRLGPNHRLTRVLTKGVAFHHSALPTDVQAEIEDAVRRGEISCLVATTTLTEGVNLPFKTVIVAHRGYWGPDGEVQLVDAPKLLNAIGRAGRAGRETEGWLILSELSAAFSQGMFNDLERSGEDINLRSTLATETALEALARLEEAYQEGADVLLSNSNAITDGFMSFIWFLADALETLRGTVTEEAVFDAVRDTLAWHQLDEPSQERLLRIATLALNRFQSEAANRRKRWARTGTSLNTAATLEDLSAQLFADCAEQPHMDGLSGALSVIIQNDRLETLLRLAENEKRGFKPQRNAPRTNLIEVDLGALLLGWLAGRGVEGLADEHLLAIADIDYRYEQLHEFIAQVFEHHLPWTIGILIAWTNSALEESGSLVRLPESLPGAIHFGVGSSEALELMIGGVRSRRLANQVAAAYQEAIGDDDQLTLRQWLANQNLPGWREAFQASPTELLDLLSYTRAPGARLVSEVLEGNGYQVPFVLLSAASAGAEVEIAFAPNEPAPARLVIEVDGTVVGEISPGHYDDIRLLQEIGIPLLVRISEGASGLILDIRLSDEAN
jgi:hypothetical protein